jgi:hypothetical protein
VAPAEKRLSARVRSLPGVAQFRQPSRILHIREGVKKMAFELTRDQRRLFRLEVRGEISGRVVGTDLPLMLRNLSGGGLLAETSTSLPVGSLHTIRLTAADGYVVIVTARCAHCRKLMPSDVPRFAVGFAFVTSNVDAIDALLDRLTSQISFG